MACDNCGKIKFTTHHFGQLIECDDIYEEKKDCPCYYHRDKNNCICITCVSGCDPQYIFYGLLRDGKLNCNHKYIPLWIYDKLEKSGYCLENVPKHWNFFSSCFRCLAENGKLDIDFQDGQEILEGMEGSYQYGMQDGLSDTKAIDFHDDFHPKFKEQYLRGYLCGKLLSFNKSAFYN